MQTRFWKLISHAGRTPAYSWHCVDIGRLSVEVSIRFPGYGAAMLNAIKHGFNPAEESWTRTTENYVTYFEPGKNPVAVAIERGKPGPRKLKTEE